MLIQHLPYLKLSGAIDIFKISNNKCVLGESSRSHSSSFENDRLLVRCIVLSGRTLQMFQRCLLPPSLRTSRSPRLRILIISCFTLWSSSYGSLDNSSWTGSSGGINWPPRSQDLTPLDLFVQHLMKDTTERIEADTREERLRRTVDYGCCCLHTRIH
jgi:hypothetical protein